MLMLFLKTLVFLLIGLYYSNKNNIFSIMFIYIQSLFLSNKSQLITVEEENELIQESKTESKVEAESKAASNSDLDYSTEHDDDDEDDINDVEETEIEDIEPVKMEQALVVDVEETKDTEELVNVERVESASIVAKDINENVLTKVRSLSSIYKFDEVVDHLMKENLSVFQEGPIRVPEGNVVKPVLTIDTDIDVDIEETVKNMNNIKITYKYNPLWRNEFSEKQMWTDENKYMDE